MSDTRNYPLYFLFINVGNFYYFSWWNYTLKYSREKCLSMEIDCKSNSFLKLRETSYQAWLPSAEINEGRDIDFAPGESQ